MIGQHQGRARRQPPVIKEHGFEPVPGLPETLPPGEHVLWRGRPRWQALAIEAFHVRKIAVYLGVLIAINAYAAWQQAGSAAYVLNTAAIPAGVAFSCVALLMILALISARSTVYTLTNRRLVFHIGMAIPVTINLPFNLIHAADIRVRGDRAGDICLKLIEGERIAYLMLWPHARRWYTNQPQPTLRCIAQPRDVAELLRRAVATRSASSSASRSESSSPPAATMIGKQACGHRGDDAHHAQDHAHAITMPMP